MLRSVLAVLAGILVMGIMVAAVQWLGHSLYPPPPGIDPTNHEAMIALISQMPKMALGIVLVAYASGTFLGAFTATTISVGHKRGVAIVVGLVMLALVALNFSVIPHPAWMVAAGLVIPLPFALLGWRLAR
ncbi:MAG TPA: hypothetical protein VFQ84_08675 [Arenimonas sp.]|uniref:hypothetical protein n=1 Tax=Arenimonas sp. TaxID=1872635 RepID=UPI002D7F05B8|nr:hypothetical protein [Arenimonas sp.]HEU0153403.1 hypothetical protein [Arenimonas sp.]